MKTSRTFKILFRQVIARRKNETAPIYVRITVNGKRTEFSLGLYYPINGWDCKMSRAIGRTSNARILNNELDSIYVDIVECYKQLRKESKFITAQTVKARYLGTDNNQATLLGLVDYHNGKMKDVLTEGTLKNYRTSTKYIKAFLSNKLKSSDVYLEQIGYSFIVDFEQYLRNKDNRLSKQELNNNGIMKHIERLNKLMNLAVKLEWITKNPFLHYDVKFSKYSRPFLSPNEMKELEEIKLNTDKYKNVRDVFIFSCYTGLSYIDMKQLTKNNIVYGIDGNKWLSFYRQKNTEPVKVPLLDKALEILEKYSDYDNSNKLLPVYSNQKMNTYIKEIATICEINKNLTCHVARHTFATTVTLSNGVPIETVSKLLGHTKLSTTQIYARVMEDKLGKDISQLQSILNTDARNVS
ncbi:MAG: integrase [Flavobacteriaceae bacterium]|nr:MAG: integrase [Flavobacteriaceae bacterium]